MPDLYIIAEAGTNHNGSLETALKLIDAAKFSGADAVKFQFINPDGLYLPKLYQDGKLIDNQVYLTRKRSLLSDAEWKQAADYANKSGLDFTASVFDRQSSELLKSLGAKYVKAASCDLNNTPFLHYLAQNWRKMIISTGMNSLAEIENTVNFLQSHNAGTEITLLHCVSIYPAKLEQMRLGRIPALREAFGLPVGFSDHTENSLASVIALAKGASIFEKHLTLDRRQEGFDHAYAMEAEMFKRYVEDLRNAKTALDSSLSNNITADEAGVQKRARRSIYAARDLNPGEIITEGMLTIVRPEGPLKPGDYYSIEGMRVKNPIKKYSAVTWEDLNRDK